MHIFSKREIEPDYSGYVDEYRFIPLTPSLEDALEKMVGGSLGDIRDAVEPYEFAPMGTGGAPTCGYTFSRTGNRPILPYIARDMETCRAAPFPSTRFPAF